MDNKPAIDPKGLKILIAGVVVMIAGFILMMGGGSDDPNIFNYEMFNFRRMVAAPIVIVSGIIVVIIAIMKKK
ncbi:MAG: DUF3098 domain-containing protein [Bacteroidales bacterium]|jgi:hypothetical protein|nr:DUF3098 domain-containing protein [Bacteroidales bacterium]